MESLRDWTGRKQGPVPNYGMRESIVKAHNAPLCSRTQIASCLY